MDHSPDLLGTIVLSVLAVVGVCVSLGFTPPPSPRCRIWRCTRLALRQQLERVFVRPHDQATGPVQTQMGFRNTYLYLRSRRYLGYNPQSEENAPHRILAGLRCRNAVAHARSL